jgi:hypothetical protein
MTGLDVTMRVLNQVNLSPHAIAEIEGQLENQQNLKDVMNWALSHPAGRILAPSRRTRHRAR